MLVQGGHVPVLLAHGQSRPEGLMGQTASTTDTSGGARYRNPVDQVPFVLCARRASFPPRYRMADRVGALLAIKGVLI